LNQRFALAANCLDKLARFFRNSPDMKSSIPPVLIIFALVCFALVQNTQAVSPPPEGGYPGGNTAEGQNALLSLTSGTYNTAVGFSSLKSNTIGNVNTAIGVNALSFNTTGINNTASGGNALYSNTTGVQNTASGVYALFLNTTGNHNTANGAFALSANTTGDANTANGEFALSANTTGGANTATGEAALFLNTTGNDNTANGSNALANNTNGADNTAVGVLTLGANTSGFWNTAVGFRALATNRTGNENTALGSHALLLNGSNGNTAVGFAALVANLSGSLNTALGQRAGQGLQGGESNNIDIGANVDGVPGESNTIRIGNTDITDTFISGISGTTVASGAAVLVDSNGHLGTLTSSKRFKEGIRPMNKTSEAIFSLEPVTFRYKKEIDPACTSQFGLVAEDVERINPDLVVRDKKGKTYSVRYEAVNAMLLNEFLKEHRKNEEQQATIAQLKSGMEALTATVKEQAAQIQKVSAQLEASKPAPQTVLNDQ
jgi:trimeric autotransporter adhesin